MKFNNDMLYKNQFYIGKLEDNNNMHLKLVSNAESRFRTNFYNLENQVVFSFVVFKT